MTLHDGWWLTRWVGKSRSGQRACVWAPEKKEESGWIKAGKPLMNESADDDEAASGCSMTPNGPERSSRGQSKPSPSTKRVRLARTTSTTFPSDRPVRSAASVPVLA